MSPNNECRRSQRCESPRYSNTASTGRDRSAQPEIAAEEFKTLSPQEQEIRDYYQYYVPLHTVVRDQLIARMTDLAVHDDIWFEDVSDAFAGSDERVYLDYTHVTGYGARLLAERIPRRTIRWGH